VNKKILIEYTVPRRGWATQLRLAFILAGVVWIVGATVLYVALRVL